ncbi:MAG: 30S ribosomal protein S9 [Patescibacteria group bacterium]|nr:30S ribosomal protein S9 [Patescibacteria group bacterium]
MTKEQTTKEQKSEDKIPKFKGKYVSVTGHRKTAVARIRIYKNGKGIIVINDVKLSDYFPAQLQIILRQPLKLTGHLKDYDLSIRVTGGGKKGQTEAVRHSIVKALIKIDKDTKDALKAKGWLTRDSRKKERKKPGLKKARRAPQWSKR